MDELSMIKILFRKVLQQTATDEEKRIVALYLHRDGVDNVMDELLPFDEWDETAAGVLSEDMIHSMNKAMMKKEGYVSVRSVKRKQWGGSMWYAAAVALLLVTGMFMFRMYRLEKNNSGRLSYITGHTEKRRVTLPDGSVVYLNADSKISFSEHAGERCVRLDGEAFFETKQDAARPFIVKTGDVHTTVLGTTFNIKAYPDENKISVAVKTGKVSVVIPYPGLKKDSMTFLITGQQVVYGRKENAFAMSAVDTAAICGWRENRLVFEDAGLGDICKILGRQYGVRFQAKNPAVFDCIYSATFNQLNLAEALEKLSLLGDLQFRRQDNIIIVNGEPCNP